MNTGHAIAIAWPETRCKQAGAWYDELMRLTGFNREGYYTVGHAAVILISNRNQVCEYFDFGRYHAPYQHGRVRDRQTDHDLIIKTRPEFSHDKNKILNLTEIIKELYRNPSCHGDGPIYASSSPIDFEKAYAFAKGLQAKGFLKYGPFIFPGSNCSRFVSSVIRIGSNSYALKLRIRFQPTVTPTPYGNLRSIGHKIIAYCSESRSVERIPINF